MTIRFLLINLKIALIFAGTLTGILSFCVSCGTGTPLLDRILANKIVFHGQVLDLDGNPVPNAKITYSGFSAAHYENAWTGGGPPDKIKYADENGRFEIRETGFTFDALVYPKLASRPTEYTRHKHLRLSGFARCPHSRLKQFPCGSVFAAVLFWRKFAPRHKGTK